MVVVMCKTVRTDLKKIWDNVVYYQRLLDRKGMQDLEIEGCCILSGIFMTLFGVCMTMVLLKAIGFALDEFDIEYTVRAVECFLKILTLPVKLHQTTHGGHSIYYSTINCHHCSVVGGDSVRLINFPYQNTIGNLSPNFVSCQFHLANNL